jgi:Methyltransferase domain
VAGSPDHLTRAARRVLGVTTLDHLVRIEPILALADELDGGHGGTLLDAGSGSVGISRWLGADWYVTAVDTSFDDYGGSRGYSGSAEAVVADVRQLPFSDESFDAVVALDLLEHLPARDRGRALAELRRVTGRRLIVGGPAGPEALEADRRLYGRLRRRPGWLAEHVSMGFPTRDDLVGALRPHGRLRLIDNEAVASHVRLVRFELSVPGFLLGRLFALPLSWALRQHGPVRAQAGAVLWRLRGRDRAPVYRTIAVLDVSRQPSD